MTKKQDQFYIPISDIDDSNRTREDFGDMLEFKQSIEDHGLLQPIAVELVDNKCILLDGGRRLKACREMKIKEIPSIVFIGPLDDLKRKQIELDATEQHKHFSHIERYKQVAEIHALMQEKHGKKTSTAADAKGWSMDDTAKKMGKSRAWVSSAITMNEAVKVLPELVDTKNEAEARQLWKSAERTIQREMLLAEVKRDRVLMPVDVQRNEVDDTYIVGDALVEVLKVEDKSQDLVEIDWPFSIGLEDKQGNYEDIDEGYISFMYQTVIQAKRIIKSNGWLIVWYASEPWQEPTFQMIKETGLRCRRIPGFWEKTQGETKRPEYYLSTNQETFYYAGGQQATIIRKGRSNRFDQEPVPSQIKTHRTQKPVKLYEDIFSTFVLPKTEATIMFAGSGAALLACSNLGIKCRGFDKNEEYKRYFTANVHKGTPGEYQSWER